MPEAPQQFALKTGVVHLETGFRALIKTSTIHIFQLQNFLFLQGENVSVSINDPERTSGMHIAATDKSEGSYFTAQ